MGPGGTWSRRRFLAGMTGLAGVIGLTGVPGPARGAVPVGGPGSPSSLSLSLPHFLLLADTHSAHARYPLILAAVDRYRSRNPGAALVTLFNGDLFERGNPVALRGMGEVDLAFLRALRRHGPVIFNLGNHEGALTPLAETTDVLARMGVTVLTSLRRSADRTPLAPPSLELREPGLAGVVAGVGTADLATYRPEVREALSIPHPGEYAERAFPRFFGSAPVPILLSHAGLAADRALLPLLPPGSLILGGHDHLRFVHRFGGSLYLHTGSWGSHLFVAAPVPAHPGSGRVHWRLRSLEMEGIPPHPGLERLRREAEEAHLTPEDREVVLTLPAPLSLPEAAPWAVEGVRRMGSGDAAVIANTTFGSGLPDGSVPRHRYHAFVRFDSPLFRLRIPADALRRVLEGANQFGAVPFPARAGEFLVASRAADRRIAGDGSLTLVTDGWVRLNGARYLGEAGRDPAAFAEVDGTSLREAGILGLGSRP